MEIIFIDTIDVPKESHFAFIIFVNKNKSQRNE